MGPSTTIIPNVHRTPPAVADHINSELGARPTTFTYVTNESRVPVSGAKLRGSMNGVALHLLDMRLRIMRQKAIRALSDCPTDF